MKRNTLVWLMMLFAIGALACFIGYESVASSTAAVRPTTQPIASSVVAWRYETVSLLTIIKELDPIAEAGGTMARWKSGPITTLSPAEQAKADAKAKAEKRMEFAHREQFEERIGLELHRRAELGWELCPAPQGTLPREIEIDNYLIWFRQPVK